MTKFGILTAVLILIGGLGIAGALIKFRPQAKKAPVARVLDSVEAITVKREDVTVEIPSQGILESATETSISAEVAGKVMVVSPKFEVGESFAEGEMILQIDRSDYQSAVSQNEANLAEAKVALQMEEARALQAEKDWKKLGDGEEPTDLVLRKPQMESAQAKITAAEAALAKAKRDLERTVIKAPFHCKVRTKSTDIGSYLAPGAPVAELYQIDSLEVRLPLGLDEFGFLDEPTGSLVKFSAEAGIKEFEWEGKILRYEGEVERRSRSVYLVAEVAPERLDESFRRFVAPGLFVKAGVTGSTLTGVVRVPRKAVYGTDRVLIISEDSRVSYRKVEILRTEANAVLVSSGVKDGEIICITPLETVIENMEVIVEELDGEPTKKDGTPGNEDKPETNAEVRT